MARLAAEYRFQFGGDVVIDLIGYRRHGHSEVDDPTITQPLLYKKIKEHPSVATLYGDRLVREGVVTTEDVAALRKRENGAIRSAFGPLDAAGVRRAHWIGHSLGGRLILETAALAPDRIDRAVLLDPAIQLLPHVAFDFAEGY